MSLWLKVRNMLRMMTTFFSNLHVFDGRIVSYWVTWGYFSANLSQVILKQKLMLFGIKMWSQEPSTVNKFRIHWNGLGTRYPSRICHFLDNYCIRQSEKTCFSNMSLSESYDICCRNAFREKDRKSLALTTELVNSVSWLQNNVKQPQHTTFLYQKEFFKKIYKKKKSKKSHLSTSVSEWFPELLSTAYSWSFIQVFLVNKFNKGSLFFSSINSM